MREKLIELFYENNVRCDQKIESLADDVMDIVANGVVVSFEIEELRADNDRLRDMWAKAVSDLSKCQAENVKYKIMLDNAYEMIGKITDRYG